MKCTPHAPHGQTDGTGESEVESHRVTADLVINETDKTVNIYDFFHKEAGRENLG
jgi:hypothetical protein